MNDQVIYTIQDERFKEEPILLPMEGLSIRSHLNSHRITFARVLKSMDTGGSETRNPENTLNIAHTEIRRLRFQQPGVV